MAVTAAGETLAGGGPGGGYSVALTVLSDLGVGHRPAKEEVIDPVLAVLDVERFKNCITDANIMDQGLSACVLVQNHTDTNHHIGKIRVKRLEVAVQIKNGLKPLPYHNIVRPASAKFYNLSLKQAAMAPKITKIESTEFSFPIEDVGYSPNGFSLVYKPGETARRKLFAIKIHTDTGVTGEYVGGNSPGAAQINMFGNYLIGKNPLHREKHWSEIKRALRKYDRMGMGPIDIALWDFAGKYYDAPIHELLGTYRKRLPAYASTYEADLNGGLDSPEAFADFAEECYDRGYGGFKLHMWESDAWGDIDRDIATVHAVGDRVGDRMDLMLDPACQYETWADALKVGKACDEHDFFWYEDPYRDAGTSQHGHRRLKEHMDTPILQTEHIRGLELHTDFIANEATDFVRADPEYDAGITGAMKLAKVAEGFGLDVEYHAPGPAQRHCMAATRNTNYYELALVHPKVRNPIPPVYKGNYNDYIDGIDDEGTVPVPDDPGLGVDYDWEFIKENATGSVHIYE